MTVAEAVAGRRAIRAYLDKPVDPAVLRRVIAAAQMAPSGYNFQPWEGVVLTGEPLRELSRRMIAAAPQEPAEYQLVPRGLPQLYKDRRDSITGPRMDAAGIARDDEAGRARLQARNFAFFGAPAALLCFVPRVMGPPQWSDVGMWLQTIMLLLHGDGLGSCPQESLYVHGRLIKQFVGVSDETHLFFCGMAIGHPDPQAPLNLYPRTRAPIDEVVRFLGA
ncbi:nitroreductase [Novosphingobium album (ex Liu et al. 2023)]|uniref:Nitroreductase n=1 Tax=Novosphingobium album (ex Liu et al. 2023) TaxID=3031130 RepID=A0ABT5WW80_9SPHN|nr:nitroreductase [Novosphingobium album (ex Liu et al. 2023)]MDE8654111.1 nitroreductase [Novosphingobium album (ex Liu et al. 2023)]